MALPSSLTIGDVHDSEWQAAFTLMFQHLEEAERDHSVRNSMQMMRDGELQCQDVLVVRDDKGLRGMTLCCARPGATGQLWPPQVNGASDKQIIEDTLAQTGLQRLRERGAKLIQSLLTPDELFLAERITRHGFHHITALHLLQCTLRDVNVPASASTKAPPQITYETFSEANVAVFEQTLLQTYQGSADFPEINGMRNIEEIIIGHQNQGEFDPNLWYLALENQQPVGVLLLSAVPDWQECELAYLGIIPEARGRGIGRLLTEKALVEAKAIPVAQLTLLVDARNQAAWDLYTKMGFSPLAHREVFLALVAK